MTITLHCSNVCKTIQEYKGKDNLHGSKIVRL